MIYLASQSPRRADLLRLAEIEFIQFAVDIDESSLVDEKPLEYLQRVVKAKLAAALSELKQKKMLQIPVLVADTIVVVDDEILQKPENFEVGGKVAAGKGRPLFGGPGRCLAQIGAD